MGSRTPWGGGLVVAVLWLIVQVVVWTFVLLATMFLSLLFLVLVGSTLDPTNWKNH